MCSVFRAVSEKAVVVCGAVQYAVDVARWDEAVRYLRKSIVGGPQQEGGVSERRRAANEAQEASCKICLGHDTAMKSKVGGRRER